MSEETFVDRAPFELQSAVNLMAEAARQAADLPDLAHLDAAIVRARAELADTQREIENEIGRRMSGKRLTIEGVGTLERHPRKSFTKWDTEKLLADILDSKLVNTETGELVDETPLEKVLQTWNLGAPRRTVVRDRLRDPAHPDHDPCEEYAQVEDQGGYTVQIR